LQDYINVNFGCEIDFQRSSYNFTFNAIVSWISLKYRRLMFYNYKIEYIVIIKAIKEFIWLQGR